MHKTIYRRFIEWTVTVWNLIFYSQTGVFQAVCCSDGKHCCPENTKCEVSSGKCMRGDSLIMDWFEKTLALRAQNVVCPDGQSQCKTGQTCCKLSSGQYGCCPLPKVHSKSAILGYCISGYLRIMLLPKVHSKTVIISFSLHKWVL